MRVLIDTNIWISVFINRDHQNFILKIFENDFIIVSSMKQIEEIYSVLMKPKVSKFINKSLIEEFLTLILKSVEIVDSKLSINVCRDKKDNYLLETAKSGHVDFIITEDNDLLILNPYEDLKIITVKEFYRTIKNK